MTDRPRLSRILSLLSALLAVAAVVLALLPNVEQNRIGDVAFLMVPASFSVVGGLLASRRPGNPIGWLCVATGLLFMIVGLQTALAKWLAGQGLLGAAGWVGELTALWVPALGIIGMHLPLRLPNGALPSPRWRAYSRACTGVIALTVVLICVDPNGGNNLPGVDQPLAIESVSPLYVLLLLFPLSFVGSIGSLMLRFRRAEGTERLQLRWIAFGAIALVMIYLVPELLRVLGVVEDDTPLPILVAGFAAISAIPVAIGVAVLRYRLYEIDAIISRALVYTALTALLVGAYVGGVLLLGLVLRPVTANSNLAVAGSTLAVAALFQPARHRIQAAVDRRFFRRRFDAQRTLEGFTRSLRSEVALGAVNARLSSVVCDTFQPAHVSVWLRKLPP